METSACRKQSSNMDQRFSNLRHESRSIKQSIPGRLSNHHYRRNSLIYSRRRQLGVDDLSDGRKVAVVELQGPPKLFGECGSDEESWAHGVSSPSSYSSCDVDDGGGSDNGEVSSGFKRGYLEQRFIKLQHEWNSMKKSIPFRFSNRHTGRKYLRIPVLHPSPQLGVANWIGGRKDPSEFQGRRLFEDSESDNEEFCYSSYSSNVNDDAVVVSASSCSNISQNIVACGITGGGGGGGRFVGGMRRLWMVLMAACAAVCLIMFGFGFVSVTSSLGQRRCCSNEFLFPT